MQTSQTTLYFGPGIYLSWPSALPTQDYPYGATPLVDDPVHGLPSNVFRNTGSVIRHHISISAMLRHLYVCRLPRQFVYSVLIGSQAHRSSMDMAFHKHRGRERRGFNMPISPDAYPGLPLALFTGHTLWPLETTRVSCQKPERQASGQSDWVDLGTCSPQLAGPSANDASVDQTGAKK
jgi:hypothetical protein